MKGKLGTRNLERGGRVQSTVQPFPVPSSAFCSPTSPSRSASSALRSLLPSSYWTNDSRRKGAPLDMAHDTNVHWHEHSVGREEREKLNGHHGCVVWFTGLSACGKSTISN